ncbi:hypothetical protein SNOG_15133 [Parastagonospora nodorum SN15]|uniref:Uncharacterized protein n=1 Tax=Phaeosphaeria nodorum (strain SN15 / ATCC MYA-4574 / FGSC 10173) TaxID=321614 RepID=Q0TZ07_PHANO|nr:hypothetical protein SNOG_15133 [Parastagonospora nodorum SN15]EAT77358.2 hypothetical protein SNOG_15133 [Parastagonospora nodorum SN15]
MSLVDEGEGAGVVLDEDSSLLDATLLVGITDGVLECISAEEVAVAALSKIVGDKVLNGSSMELNSADESGVVSEPSVIRLEDGSTELALLIEEVGVIDDTSVVDTTKDVNRSSSITVDELIVAEDGTGAEVLVLGVMAKEDKTDSKIALCDTDIEGPATENDWMIVVMVMVTADSANVEPSSDQVFVELMADEVSAEARDNDIPVELDELVEDLIFADERVEL